MKQTNQTVVTYPTSALSAPEEFKAVLDAIKGIHDGLFDRGFKIAAALTGVLGWFAAKTNPLPQLCGKPELIYAAILVLIFGYAAVAYLYVRDYQRAQSCERYFIVQNVAQTIYLPYRLTVAMVTIGMLVQLGMFIFVGASISLLYKEGQQPKECTVQNVSAGPIKP